MVEKSTSMAINEPKKYDNTGEATCDFYENRLSEGAFHFSLFFWRNIRMKNRETKSEKKELLSWEMCDRLLENSKERDELESQPPGFLKKKPLNVPFYTTVDVLLFPRKKVWEHKKIQ